jgi:hypothetical protein
VLSRGILASRYVKGKQALLQYVILLKRHIHISCNNRDTIFQTGHLQILLLEIQTIICFHVKNITGMCSFKLHSVQPLISTSYLKIGFKKRTEN